MRNRADVRAGSQDNALQPTSGTRPSGRAPLCGAGDDDARITPTVYAHRTLGRAALGTVLHAPELWEIAAPMLPMWTGAVGGGTRNCGRGTRRVARVLRRVAGHRSAVARSYLARFFTHSRLWEIALGVLPGSSGVLPATGRPLPSRTSYVSSRRRSVGGGTRRVARVVWRVAGLTLAVAGS